MTDKATNDKKPISSVRKRKDRQSTAKLMSPTLEEYKRNLDFEALRKSGVAQIVATAIQEVKGTTPRSPEPGYRSIVDRFIGWISEVSVMPADELIRRQKLRELFKDWLLFSGRPRKSPVGKDGLARGALLSQTDEYRRIRGISLAEASEEICDFILQSLLTAGFSDWKGS